MPLGECGLTCRAHSKAMSTVYSYDRNKLQNHFRTIVKEESDGRQVVQSVERRTRNPSEQKLA